MKKPIVDLSDCVLCELCVEYCPEVFKLNNAGFIEVTDLSEYPEDEVDEVIKCCPTDCIRWAGELE